MKSMASGDQTKIKKRILCVEDNVDQAKYLVGLLSEEGFDCFRSHNMVEALAFLEKVSPDLVIMDLAFPYQSDDDPGIAETGLELLEIIKRLAPSPPVIVCSVWYVVEIVHRCYQLGVTSFVAKPFTREQLLTAVNEAIAKPHSPGFEPQEGGAEPSTAPLEETLISTLAAMTGGFCHDIANSLLGVYGTALVAQKRSSEADSRIPGMVFQILQTVKDFQQFIHPFYQRDSQPAQSLTWADFEPALREIVPGVVDLAVIDLRIEVSHFKEELRVPKALLRHLVTPILANANNAIKSKSEPFGRIQVTLGPLDELGDLRLVVLDDGPGWGDCLAEIKSRLRKSVFHFSPETTGGYGLINLNRIVRRLKGSLILSESPLGGAQVEIRLPRNVYYAEPKAD